MILLAGLDWNSAGWDVWVSLFTSIHFFTSIAAIRKAILHYSEREVSIEQKKSKLLEINNKRANVCVCLLLAERVSVYGLVDAKLYSSDAHVLSVTVV